MATTFWPYSASISATVFMLPPVDHGQDFTGDASGVADTHQYLRRLCIGIKTLDAEQAIAGLIKRVDQVLHALDQVRLVVVHASSMSVSLLVVTVAHRVGIRS